MAEDFPTFFREPRNDQTVLSRAALFWEKVAGTPRRGKPAGRSPTPQYFSRHFYDIAMLLETEDGKAAAQTPDLLAQVARHKSIFFRSAGKQRPQPGSLRLIPSAAGSRISAPITGPGSMMFDAKAPAFDDILAPDRAVPQDDANR